MRLVLASFVALHAAIHLMGTAKAFGWNAGNQLRLPVSFAAGMCWTLAAVLLLAGVLGLAIRAGWWWYPTLAGVVLSQVMIISAWSDAKFGTIANIVVMIPVLVTALNTRAASFSKRFVHDRDTLLSRTIPPARIITDAELLTLRPLMQRYLRNMGVVGRPHVYNMRVVFKAAMRSSATSPWMQSAATQYEFFAPPARLFHMTASRAGVPFDVLHRYVDGAATFQVKIAALFPMIDKRGAGLTNDETVTLMNDIVVMAPAAVLDLPFVFETTGEHTLRATFQNGGYTVRADLEFDAAGDLVGFRSSDRAHDRDGGAAQWSTPISGYRVVDGIRVGTLGDANWADASGEWTYGRFEIVNIAYNVTR